MTTFRDRKVKGQVHQAAYRPDLKSAITCKREDFRTSNLVHEGSTMTRITDMHLISNVKGYIRSCRQFVHILIYFASEQDIKISIKQTATVCRGRRKTMHLHVTKNKNANAR